MEITTFAGEVYAALEMVRQRDHTGYELLNELPGHHRRAVLAAAAQRLLDNPKVLARFYQNHADEPVLPNILVHRQQRTLGINEAEWDELVSRIPLGEHRQFLMRQAAWFNSERAAADYVRRAVAADEVEDLDMQPFIQEIVDAATNDDVDELRRLDLLLNEGSSDARVCFMAVGGMHRFATEAASQALLEGSAKVAEYVAEMPGVGAEVIVGILNDLTQGEHGDRRRRLLELRPLFQGAPHVLALAIAKFPEHAEVLLQP